MTFDLMKVFERVDDDSESNQRSYSVEGQPIRLQEAAPVIARRHSRSDDAFVAPASNSYR